MTTDFTTLKVSKKLTTKLKEIGTKAETYEDIIWRLIDSKKEAEKESAIKYKKTGERRRGYKTGAQSNHCGTGRMEIPTRQINDVLPF